MSNIDSPKDKLLNYIGKPSSPYFLMLIFLITEVIEFKLYGDLYEESKFDASIMTVKIIDIQAHDNRELQLSSNIVFHEFEKEIGDLYRIDQPFLQYKDKKGLLITIDTNYSLTQAIRWAEEESKRLREEHVFLVVYLDLSYAHWYRCRNGDREFNTSFDHQDTELCKVGKQNHFLRRSNTPRINRGYTTSYETRTPTLRAREYDRAPISRTYTPMRRF